MTINVPNLPVTASTFSVWDGDWAILEEYTTGNVLVESYVQGYHGLVKTLQANVYYYQDELGSTSHIASASGALLEYYKYDLYGKPTYFDSTSQPLNSSTYAVKDLFTGQRWIPELGLYDDRNRFMSPDLGRFLQPDPIGFKGDGSNLYRYCGNDWANKTDPMGLFGDPQADRANLQNNQQDQHMMDPINVQRIQVFKPDAFTVEAQRAIAEGPRLAQNGPGVQGATTKELSPGDVSKAIQTYNENKDKFPKGDPGAIVKALDSPGTNWTVDAKTLQAGVAKSGVTLTGDANKALNNVDSVSRSGAHVAVTNKGGITLPITSKYADQVRLGKSIAFTIKDQNHLRDIQGVDGHVQAPGIHFWKNIGHYPYPDW